MANSANQKRRASKRRRRSEKAAASSPTVSIDFLIPIPGFFFLRELNLIGRVGRVLASIVWPVALGLAVLTVFVGPQVSLRTVNNTFIVAVFVALFIALIRIGPGY
jgi:hypothetical protein